MSEAAFLDQLATTEMVRDGCVNLIGVNAIRDRLGSRWARRQTDVWLYVDKSIERLLPGAAVFRRISETDFVIAISGATRGAAQAMCLKVLTEALTHFLGGCDPADVVIRNVTKIGANTIACAPIDIDGLMNFEDAIKLQREPPAAIDAAAKRDGTILSATGLTLEVDFVMEPLFNLRTRSIAGLCAEPVVRDAPSGRRLPGFVLSRLPDADLARIDSLGLAFAQNTPSTFSRSQSLLVPLSFQTLSSTKFRAAALAELRARHLNSAWIVLLSHIDHGTPPGRLTEMAAFLRPCCDAVFASVSANSPTFGHLSQCRFKGLVIDLERWAKEPERVVHYIQTFGDKAAGLASVLAVRGLASESMYEVARAAGLTHASLRDISRARPLAA